MDGEDWVFARHLIKPFFNRDMYTNTERIRPFVDTLFTLLPPDGETLNIQPLMQRWVSNHDFSFDPQLDLIRLAVPRSDY